LLKKGYDVLQVNYQGIRYGNNPKITTIPNMYDFLSAKEFLGQSIERTGKVGLIGRSHGGYGFAP